MKRIKIIGLALLAVFALGAISATMAQAAEAPYYGVESKRLGAGEEKKISVEQLSEYKLTAAGVAITCKKSSVVAGATINGSAAGEPGTSKEKITFSECTVAGNGTCTVGNGTSKEIQTEALKNELVYDAGSKESKSVGVEFTPETGNVLSKVTLVGAGCSPVSAGVLAVEGQVVAQALGGKTPTEFLLELGKAPVLAVAGAVKFPTPAIKSIILFKAGVGTQKSVSLKFAGIASSLVGESKIELSPSEKWCVIS
jgi:hypothetical protein